MKTLRKIFSTVLACGMLFSAVNVNVFAKKSDDEISAKTPISFLAAKAKAVAEASGLTVIDNMIDYSIYDEDMIYIKEQADMVAEYNALKTQAANSSYTAWNWDTRGIYSRTSGRGNGLSINYSFTPVAKYLYFNSEITGNDIAPFLSVNKLQSNDDLEYVGAYYVTASGTNSFTWTNYKRTLTAGQPYIFSFWAGNGNNWSTLSVDIYKTAM